MTGGYSGTPLVTKLGIREGQQLALVGAPPGWAIPDLPPGVEVVDLGTASGPVDLAVAFFASRAALASAIAALSERITPDGALWVAWPRRAAGHSSDLGDEAVRALALPLGLVDVKVAALGEDWSGLKLVWRRELRAGRR